MNKFDKWWYEFGGGYATPGGDEEDAARYAWESALDAAVEAANSVADPDFPPTTVIKAINKLRSEL